MRREWVIAAWLAAAAGHRATVGSITVRPPDQALRRGSSGSPSLWWGLAITLRRIRDELQSM
jgi:hypothetical protein